MVEIEQRNIQVTIEGISPLLQHRFPDDNPETTKPSKRKTGVKDYRAEGEFSAYRTPEGKLYQPAAHIEAALVKGATSFQIPGKGKKTYKDLFKSSIFVMPDALVHEIQEYEIDARPVVVIRARVMRYRPKLNNWRLTFTIQIQDPDLPSSVVKEILEYTGLRVGIGDYRPRVGRFTVVQWEDEGAAT